MGTGPRPRRLASTHPFGEPPPPPVDVLCRGFGGQSISKRSVVRCTVSGSWGGGSLAAAPPPPPTQKASERGDHRDRAIGAARRSLWVIEAMTPPPPRPPLGRDTGLGMASSMSALGRGHEGPKGGAAETPPPPPPLPADRPDREVEGGGGRPIGTAPSGGEGLTERPRGKW